MPKIFRLHAVIWIGFANTIFTSTSLQCGQQIHSEPGIILAGFKYKSFLTDQLWSCFENCRNDLICQSINFDFNTNVCEFNFETKSRKPTAQQRRDSWVYMEIPNIAAVIVGMSCQKLHESNPTLPSGLYYLYGEGAGGSKNLFLAYCDMKTHGGGWTMCYTTHGAVNPKTEVTYDPQKPYGSHGYRTDCNSLTFNEVLFINEETTQSAYFRRQDGQAVRVGATYTEPEYATRNGLWNGYGVASTSHVYQLLLCESWFYNGFLVTGFYHGRFKRCIHWEGDFTSVYFRTNATADLNYAGVAFNENGARPLPSRLISVGIRARTPDLPTSPSGSTHVDVASCQELYDKNSSLTSGLYYLDPDGGHSNRYPAYCDMTTHGGGWTMCYTTSHTVNPKTEVTYDPNKPYGTNGYRTNCNNLMFNEILFVNEENQEKAYFRRQGGQILKVNEAYTSTQYATSNGLWIGHGVANTSYWYQLLLCDNYFYSGFFISGVYNGIYGAFKRCDHWAGDAYTDYYRTSTSTSTDVKYVGVAFKEQGHLDMPNKLVSVGLRTRLVG